MIIQLVTNTPYTFIICKTCIFHVPIFMSTYSNSTQLQLVSDLQQHKSCLHIKGFYRNNFQTNLSLHTCLFSCLNPDFRSNSFSFCYCLEYKTHILARLLSLGLSFLFILLAFLSVSWFISSLAKPRKESSLLY